MHGVLLLLFLVVSHGELKEKEKEKEGLLPVRGLNVLKADSRGAASPATQT